MPAYSKCLCVFARLCICVHVRYVSVCRSTSACVRVCVSLLEMLTNGLIGWKACVTKTQVKFKGRIVYGERDKLVLYVSDIERERRGREKEREGESVKNSLWLLSEYSPHAPLSGAGARLCRACSRLCVGDSDERRSGEEEHKPATPPPRLCSTLRGQ